MLSGLNHITLATRDLQKSLDFYVTLLGFQLRAKWNGGAYLSLGELWFCLACESGKAIIGEQGFSARDYSHIAFSIAAEDFSGFSSLLLAKDVKQWKENKSEGASLYILDPDGHQLEIHVGSLHSRLKSLDESRYPGLELGGDF